MKTRRQVEPAPRGAARRKGTPRPAAIPAQGGGLTGTFTAGDSNAIRSFQVNVPEAELTDLNRRIKATRWPEKETVADDSQGVQLATVQALARYWATEYDWRKVEARLNALPN